jgi:hypothetical protein
MRLLAFLEGKPDLPHRAVRSIKDYVAYLASQCHVAFG